MQRFQVAQVSTPRWIASRSFTVVFSVVLGAWLLASGSLAASETAIPLTDPQKPVLVEVSIVEGDIVVEGYDGDKVLLITESEDDEDGDDERDGLRRIPRSSFGLIAEEENNVVTVRMGGGGGDGVRLRVPRRSSLHLRTVNDGDIEIEGVEGDHELQNTNGDVVARRVSGTVQANTVNGDVWIDIRRFGQRPMAFSSLNGDLDVTLPKAIGARLELQTMQGEIYTDFDVALDHSAPITEQGRVANRYRVEIEQSVTGAINGGGPALRMKTHNGDILIRKGN
jgi:hypothetical protein